MLANVVELCSGEFPVDCPLHDSTLRIHYKGMLPSEKDTVFYDTRRDNAGGDPLEFKSGEGMVCLFHIPSGVMKSCSSRCMD